MRPLNLFFTAILSSHPLIVLSMMVFALTAGYLGYTCNWHNDFTQNKRNSIANDSKKILDTMPDAIYIKAVASNGGTKGKYFKKSIQSFLARYQRHKPNIRISFLAPERDMREIRQLGLKQEGDWLVEYQNQQAFFTLPYHEESFTNLLMKMQTVPLHSFFFTEGHSEPKLNNASPDGLQQLANIIDANGLKAVQSHSLAKLSNANVLVINAPKQAFSQDEISLVRQHIEHGGNMIWLIDSRQLQGLEPIADALNIDVSNGIVVDLSNQSLGLDPTLVTAYNYASHEIFKDFSLRCFFPNARRISNKDNASNWRHQHIVGVAENGWLTKKMPTTLSSEELSQNVLKSGPINIAIAMERPFKKYQQRIIVIGSSQFLSNQFIEQGGNQGLASRLFKWISVKHSPLSIPQTITKDAVVVIDEKPVNRYWILAIFNGFQFVLPVVLLIIAINVWLRRSRL